MINERAAMIQYVKSMTGSDLEWEECFSLIVSNEETLFGFFLLTVVSVTLASFIEEVFP